MFQLRRRGQTTYEDLLHELEGLEQQLLPENGALAMSLMVLEAKIRDRFQAMDRQLQNRHATGEEPLFTDEDMTLDEIRALIPRDLPPFPSMTAIEENRKRKRTIETVGTAAVLALATALGVFGLATILQLVLSWLF